ncbi:L-type lectin-domain containing receptor kinase IV.1-like [Zingiber officinale]|uniref:non-specific serine/threonine protein kinase n=1 Tax=Zingiber officinale TaxID=94328 RepID=A0A8J5HSL4_ZINOF|nr:L-type lectin-domain containing receptor kinase IV.1-like [Zingiber officinale]KAG6534667.1 hypothetical protein ZIOFF_008570 [Zingiber officinale]
MSQLPMLSAVLCFIVVAAATAADEAFVYNGFVGANLSLNGFAEITGDGLIKLTNDTEQAQGHAFYPLPLRFKDSATGAPRSFSATFVFAIVPEHSDVSGHGIAFAIAPSVGIQGSMPSQHLGLFNVSNIGSPSNHIVAVEFDTVMSVEFYDINNNHVGIDVNTLVSANSSPVAYFESGIPKNLTLISGDPMQVWVDFDGRDLLLQVVVAPLSVSKPEIPIVSSKINLSSIVLDEMFVGFSASTGAATGSHYILGWSFNLNGDAQPLNISKLPPVPLPRSQKKKSDVLAISLPLATVILSSICITAMIFIAIRRRKFAELLEDWELEYGPHRFSYKDLYRATRGFNEANLLGAGGFGRVYRGVLPSSKVEVAVKRVTHESKQGIKEFISEVVSMGKLKHRNLVQLLGYCRRQGELLLVYDYMPNRSLDKFIFYKDRPRLDWSQRFRVVKGVAAGLYYLHDGWEQVVIHRDIKASNVLLDGEFNGKLGDFGLARLYDHGENPHTTHIVGTLGYLAPELSKTGKATKETDVYAFGAFLLEVACGRRPLEVKGSADSPGLVEFALECWKKKALLEARDADLGEELAAAAEEEVEAVLKLGLLCSHPDPMARPTMKQVVQFLEGDASLPSMLPEGLIDGVATLKYDESFDDFLKLYPSSSHAEALLQQSSPLFSGGG